MEMAPTRIPGSTTRRSFIGGLFLVGTASLLQACGPAAPSPAAPAPTSAPAATATSPPSQPATAPTSAPAATSAPASGPEVKLSHWSSLTASDAEIWDKVITSANQANTGKFQIAKETIPGDQIDVKILAGVASGSAPDFGWTDAGLRLGMVKKGVIVPQDDVLKGVGLDFTDFTEGTIDQTKYDGKIYLTPLDAMSWQMHINTQHAQDAGLDVSKPPATGDELLTWADKMTKREGNKVTRSGFLMIGSGGHNHLVWGIVFEQMGGKRLTADFKQVALMQGDAAKKSAQWIVDLFDKYKVASRDVSDRYKAFGVGQASMFWTGPWTLNGYIHQQGLSFVTVPIPKVGNEQLTCNAIGGQEMYKQDKTERYATTALALKWLSDNSFVWNTEGRGASLRKSILARSDYKTAGTPWKYRGVFSDGMAFAKISESQPVVDADAFTYYYGTEIGKWMDPVFGGTTKIDDGLAALQKAWEQDLAQG
jgi:ABC-type glycerol-3-phosphate transport system substrate-binding protein